MVAEPTKIVLDIDTGIDDALAVWLALNSPEVEVLGCSTVAGNTTVAQATTNTLAVLELGGRADIPVAMGAARPLTRRLTTATHFHGPLGLGHLELPTPKAQPLAISGPQFLVDMANKYEGELTVVATGPLTNLAIALLLDPNWGRKLKRLVIMGGAVHSPGNITAKAEANFHNDPEAAQAVMSCGANDITIVGLDVTLSTIIYWKEIQHLAEEEQQGKLSPVASAAVELLRFYTQPYGQEGGAHLHDPLAVGVVTHPDIVTTERMQVDIETSSPLTRGQSVGYNKIAFDIIENKGDYDDSAGIRVEHPSNVNVCLGVQSAEFVKIFRDRLGLI